MKKFLLLAITLVTAMNLTGCVILKSQTEIKDNGSGTAEITMSISPSVKEALLEMKELDDGQSQDMDLPLLGDLTKSDLEKAAAGQGVKIRKFEKGMVDGRETMTIALAFDNLKGFSFAMGRIMGGSESDGGMGIFDAGDGNLVLKEAHYDFPAPPAKEEAKAAEKPTSPQNMDPAKMQKQMELAGKLMAAMSELDVSIRITVPGDVISTNAPESDGRTSIWTVNSDNMMTMQKDFSPTIVFSGKGLKIKPLTE